MAGILENSLGESFLVSAQEMDARGGPMDGRMLRNHSIFQEEI
jgi:hypothetical protein